MEALNKLADKLVSYLESAEVFAKAQLPDFVNQFITYEAWKVDWQFKVALIALVILAIWQVINIVVSIKNVGNLDECFGWIIAMVGIAGFIALCFSVDTYTSLKKMEMAPKVYMVEQAKHLLRDK